MGLFFADKKSGEAPNRKSREQCWESRDIFFKCLDNIKVIDPLDPEKGQEIKKNCGKEDQQFQKDCVASWVKYFKQKRPFDKKKAKILKQAKDEGAEVIQMSGYRK
ncbi:hypothetical protein HII12_002390 [Brettanomyces bruxellensis]|uniref:Cytochrome c oxidase assembly factor 6 n=1 Tax=Dekkera bruxellensis TaxID=5007 RepID=A0A8H6BIZ6_DEKBR|nr:uncharacterized protein BRETT_002327 [Brettanomyces bruxellensis]KAF6012237.1 hypothetical protein HII12_002390 [Brettanomyces bruxellensis]QOU22155.1 hypothetical protein BRETT_002327 [Brettanomyces bruxellensis]